MSTMKETRAAPRLQFTAEELDTEGLNQPATETDDVSAKRERMKARLRKEHGRKEAQAVEQAPPAASGESSPSTTFTPSGEPPKLAARAASVEPPKLAPLAVPGEQAKRAPPRLHFEEDKVALPSKQAQGILKQTVSAEVHRQTERDDEENPAVQEAHFAEEAGERIVHAGRQRYHTKLRHDQHRLSQTEKMPDYARKAQGQSNPLSRAYQRQAIRREYLAAKAGRSTGYAAGRSAQKAVRSTSSAVDRAMTFFSPRKHNLLTFALIGMLAFVMHAMSSCAPLVESGLQSVIMGTYPAEEADIKAAERAYKGMEDELQNELDHYERFHPGYDEYIVKADELWHDPYALISILSAYRGGEEWTIDDVYGTLQMLFDWQYVRTQTVATETRYREEIREGTRLVTDPVTGETRTEPYTYPVQVPYAYSICTVTVENKVLSRAPVYIMSREKMGLYALYMSTLGNMPDLFRGNPHASELKDPLEYDVPQELLDADPKFALLVEEANKRLGYPYVWGGYEPDTSFDCSGFISWLFTSTGVDDIGHLGATGLYNRSRKIAPEDAKPGDVIFFTGTMGEGTDGITHCGLYVGDNMMVHSGNPCSYADLTRSYWQEHFYGFGRLYEH